MGDDAGEGDEEGGYFVWGHLFFSRGLTRMVADFLRHG